MKYFTISELTASATALREGIDNSPTESAYHLLHVLVEQLLDPIREAWGEPIVVSSGYRCRELNELVGGATHSHHLLGCAADLIGGLPLNSQARLLNEVEASAVANKVRWPRGKATDAPLASAQRGGTSVVAENGSDLSKAKTNKDLFDFIVKMQQAGRIRFTQLIAEDNYRWLHISYVPGNLCCQIVES